MQERLGHATISITLDIYSHVATGLHSDAAEQVAGLVSMTRTPRSVVSSARRRSILGGLMPG